MTTTQKNRLAKSALWLLTAAAAAAMVRSLFVGLEIDEEYALSLGFRLVSGDRLFATMWEPHQLSALTTAPLVALFLGVTSGTTGLVLFVRVVMLLVKAGLSFWFYRSLRGALGGRAAWLLALGLFVFTPKWFLGPDYVSQQFHYTLAAFLFWYGYFAPGPRQGQGVWRVAAGAVCACLSFLAYPQSVAAAPVFLVGMVVLARSGKRSIPRGAAVFAVTCGVCGGVFLLWALQGMAFDFAALLERITLVLNDPQYDFTAGERLAELTGQALGVVRFSALPLAGTALLTALWVVRCRPGAVRSVETALWLYTGLLGVWCLLWALREESLDYRHVYLAATLAGGWTFWADRRRAQDRGVRQVLFWLGWLPGVAAYLMILRSTLIALPTTFMYLFWPAVCGVAALALRHPVFRAGRWGLAALLTVLLLYPTVSRLWLVQVTGWKPHSLADTTLVRIENGPAKGIWADEKAADMQECLYEALAPYGGKQLLQAIGEQHGLGFLMADGTMTVAQASVISGTDSDPRFVQYYEEMPEKLPDVILYDDAEVRDMAAFHAWIEENLPLADRYTVTHGTASLQVLVVDKGA